MAKTIDHSRSIDCLKLTKAYACLDKSSKNMIGSLFSLAIDPNQSTEVRSSALALLSVSVDPTEQKTLGFVSIDELTVLLEQKKNTGGKTLKNALDTEENTFAVVLKKLIKERRMSQVELAEKIGVLPSAISNMLKRTCRPQWRTILRIADVFGVKPESLWKT